MRGPARRLGGLLGHAAVREDPLERAEAVVILGGAPRFRAPAAVALWREGWASSIVAVGGSDGHQEARRTLEVLDSLAVPRSVVHVIEADAPGTWDEALQVSALAAREEWSRVLVVTSAYHTRRAAALFAAALGPDVDVRLRVATDEPWRPDAWWYRWLHVRLLAAEPLKYLAWRTGVRGAWWSVRSRARWRR